MEKNSPKLTYGNKAQADLQVSWQIFFLVANSLKRGIDCFGVDASQVYTPHLACY